MFTKRGESASQSHVEVKIPAEIAEQFSTRADLDRYVKEQIEILGHCKVRFRVPDHLAGILPSDAQDVTIHSADGTQLKLGADPTVFGAGLLAAAKAGDVCSGSQNGETVQGPPATRRRVLTIAAAAMSAVGLSHVFSVHKAAANHICYDCGTSYCYFSSFYGCYVKGCRWWKNHCGTFCCSQEFICYSCGTTCAPSVC